MCLMNKYGFPRSKSKSIKRFITSDRQSFQSGDVVALKQPVGKYKGRYVGPVSVRNNGRFDVTTPKGTKITSSYKNFFKIYKFSGYHIKVLSV